MHRRVPLSSVSATKRDGKLPAPYLPLRQQLGQDASKRPHVNGRVIPAPELKHHRKQKWSPMPPCRTALHCCVPILVKLGLARNPQNHLRGAIESALDVPARSAGGVTRAAGGAFDARRTCTPAHPQSRRSQNRSPAIEVEPYLAKRTLPYQVCWLPSKM